MQNYKLLIWKHINISLLQDITYRLLIYVSISNGFGNTVYVMV